MHYVGVHCLESDQFWWKDLIFKRTLLGYRGITKLYLLIKHNDLAHYIHQPKQDITAVYYQCHIVRQRRGTTVKVWPRQASNHSQGMTYLLLGCFFCGNKILSLSEDKMSCYDGHNACSVQMHVTQEDTGCVTLLNNAPPLMTLCNCCVDSRACLCGWTWACLCLPHLTQSARLDTSLRC